MKKEQELSSYTIILLAKKANESIFGQDYVDWAVQMLTEGFDSPSLAILAGLDIVEQSFSLSEAEEIFKKVFFELNWSLPDDGIILRKYLFILATKIKNGTIDPDVGIEHIHREIVSPLGHPSDTQDWCFLWEGNYPMSHPTKSAMIPEEEYSSIIIEYVTEWLAEKCEGE